MATLTYERYTGILEVDVEAGELFGHNLGMRDLITFQGKTIEEARKSFQESVDFYLECCRTEGKTPDRLYSGRFTVRITPGLHRRLAILAETGGVSLNEVVAKALPAIADVPVKAADVPGPTWQEVKTRLEAARPNGGASPNGGQPPEQRKPTRGHTLNRGRK